MSDLTRALLDELLEELAGDPVALERLRELVAEPTSRPGLEVRPPAFTVRSLAAELGRTERSVRGAIARGELEAVKRGRGYVIAADAVAAWARAPAIGQRVAQFDVPRRQRSRAEPGPMARGLA